MQVEYRQLFLKDLKKLAKQPIYQRVYDLAFKTLVDVQELKEINNLKALRGSTDRYRIRIGNYRVGIRISGGTIKNISYQSDRLHFDEQGSLGLGFRYAEEMLKFLNSENSAM